MQAGAVWVIVRNPRVQSNEIQVLMQKNLAPCTYSFKESCHQVLFIAIIFEPHSSSIQGLDCIYCPQPAELHCDSSCSAPTGMPELEGKDFDSPGARSFLAVTYLGLTESRSSVLFSQHWNQERALLCGAVQARESHLGRPRSPLVDNEGIGWDTVFFK